MTCSVSPAILRQLGVPVDDLQRHARELAAEDSRARELLGTRPAPLSRIRAVRVTWKGAR